MKKESSRFVKGKIYSVDETTSFLHQFDKSFCNIAPFSEELDDFGDRVKCLRNCKVTVEWEELCE